MSRLYPSLVLFLCSFLPLAAAPESGLNPVGQLATARDFTQGVGNNFAFARLENGVQIRINGIYKNILFYGPDIIRVNANPGQPHTAQSSLTVVLPPSGVPFEVKDSEASLELSSSSLRVTVDKKSGAISFLRPDGSVYTRENGVHPCDVKEVTISEAATYEVKQNFTLTPDESLYGLGQYNDRYMDYRGKQVMMVQSNIGIVVPFLVSTNRYGIVWDIYSKSIFKDDENGASFWAESAPAGVDYYFIGGKDMDGVIAGYRKLTGPTPMFSKSAFGLWMSKERYQTQDRLIEVVEDYRKAGIPLDYIVQDWQYWGGNDGTWSGMTWDKVRFPDPKALTKTLHDDLHVKLMCSIWPTVGNDTELAKELDAKGLRHAPLHWISKKARVYDAYSEEGRRIYFKYIKSGLLDAGVDALWMDGTEVEVGNACPTPEATEKEIKTLGKNAMGDYTRYLNTYTLVTIKGTYEGQRATGNKRVFTLTRSAFLGQQRYGAISWSGDTQASYQVFRDQISGGVNVAMAGQPYWTQDTGGFFVKGKWKQGEQSPEYRELFARWHQFGAFNPIYRIHGTDIERELYIFKSLDPEIYQSLITANHLRYRMMPYVYSMAWMSTDQAYTMMRGLPMDFPDDQAARKLDDEFMFGSLLVHPVTRPMYRVEQPPLPSVPAGAFTTPDGKPGLAVQYFEGKNFEKAAGQTTEVKVDHTWPWQGEPPAGLKGYENFSARWNATLTIPADGEYEIGVEADDGVRVWLDDKMLIDDWKSGPARSNSGKLTFTNGQKVALKIDYFQGGNNRKLRFFWRTPGYTDPLAGKIDNVMETYLPAGAEWYDFWTNERLKGGSMVKKACPLDILPLYVRAGSIIPLSPVMNYATEKPDAPYEIRIYPGADAKFVIYEDDNETYDYEKGQRATVELIWDDGAGKLTIGQRKGSFPGMVAKRQFQIVIAGPAAGKGIGESAETAKSISYTGEPVTVNFQ